MRCGVLNRSFVLARRAAAGGSWPEGLSSWIDDLLQVSSLPRRRFLSLSTLGASTLLANPTQLQISRSRGRIAFHLGGKECWILDERYFTGRPKLTYRESDRIEIELQDAFFPGTDVPADLICRLKQDRETWTMHMVFRLGAWECNGDFCAWLRGETPAQGIARGAGALMEVSSGRLFCAETTHVEFFPSWKFAFKGQPAAFLEGLGEPMPCSKVVFSLDAGKITLLSGNQASIRTKAIAMSEPQKWGLPQPFSGEPQLAGIGPQFESALWEARQDSQGRREAAVLFEPPHSGAQLRASIGEEWRDVGGKPFSLPLEQPSLAFAARPGFHEALLVAAFPKISEAAYSGALRAHFGAAGDDQLFELGFQNGELVHSLVEPAVLSLSAALKGGIAEMCPTATDSAKGCVTPTQRKDSWNFWRGFVPPFRAWRPGPKTRPMGVKTQWGLSLDSYALKVARAQDLLLLTFRFKDLYLKSHFAHAPEVTPAGKKGSYQTGYLIVEFPPQSILEQSFYETDSTVNPPQSDAPLRPPPIQSRIAGVSRLVFKVKQPMDYSLEGLLDWANLELNVPWVALSPDQEPEQLVNRIAPPGDLETALEVPYRLLLSPHKDAVWLHHKALICDAAGRIELWNTRLAVRGKGGAPDESASAGRTVRAVWSPDYPYSPQPNDGYAPFPAPTRPSLTAEHRSLIVTSTSDFSRDQHQLDGMTVKVRNSAPVVANRFALSALGASINLEGHWNPTVAPQTLLEWIHRAELGRDNFVRIVTKYYGMPNRYPLSLVYEVERKFEKVGGATIAYLRSKYYIKYRAPRIDYTRGLGLPHQGRWTLFRALEADITRCTPYLDSPEQLPVSCSTASNPVFWPKVGGKDYMFEFLGYDQDNQPVPLRSALLMAPAEAAYSITCLDSMMAIYHHSDNRSRRKVVIGGASLGLVPSARPDADRLPARDAYWATIREDATLIPGNSPADKIQKLRDADQPPFYPIIESLRVGFPQLSKLTGKPEENDIQFSPLYIRSGFDQAVNRGKVYAELLDTDGKQTLLTFGSPENPNGDKTALASPNSKIVGISLPLGPFGGSSSASKSLVVPPAAPGQLPTSNGAAGSVASGQFNPADFFGGGDSEAKLLGVIPLKDIIKAAVGLASENLGEAPQILQSTLYGAEDAIISAAQDAVKKLDGAFSKLPAPLQNRLQPTWQAVQSSLQELKAKKNAENLATLIQNVKRLVDECRTITNDPVSAFSADIERMRRAVFGQLGFFSLLQQLADVRAKFDEIRAAALAYKAAFQGTTQALAMASQAAKQEFDDWLKELDSLQNQLVRTLETVRRELERSAQDFKQVDLQLLLGGIAKFQYDLKILQDRAAEILGGFRIDENTALPVAAKAAMESSLRIVVAQVRKADQAFRANLELVVNQLDSSLSAQLQELKGLILAKSRELEKAALDANHDFARLQLSLQRDYLDAIRRMRDAIPPGTRLVLNLTGTPAELRSAITALTISDSDRTRINALSGAAILTAATAIDVRDQLEAWGFDYTQLSNLRDRLQSNPAMLRAEFGAIASQLSGRLQQKLQQRIQNETNLLLGGVADLVAANQDRLMRGLYVLDQLNLVRDRSMAVMFLAGSIPQDVSTAILSGKNAVESRIGEYQNDLKTNTQALANLIDQFRTGIPKELQPLLDAVLGKTVILLRQFETGVKGPADLPEMALALQAAVAKLLQLLSNPLRDLTDLINFKGLLDEVLLSVVPESQTFRYAWTPALADSNNGLFVSSVKGVKGTFSIDTTAKIPLRPNVTPSIETTAKLANVTINLLPGLDVISLPFNSIIFTSKTGGKTDVSVSLGAVEFKGPLKFVQELQSKLNPSSGPFLILSPERLLAGFRFALPSITLGAFSATNLRFYASIAVYFNGQPLRLELGVSDFANPFALSAGILGGRGYFFMALTVDGLQEISGAFELGAIAQLNLAGIARGVGYVMFGARFSLVRLTTSAGKTGTQTEICGYVRVGGQLSIVGIISVSVELYVRLCYVDNPSRLYGSATLRVEIHLLFFSQKFERTVEYTFAGNDGKSTNKSLAQTLVLPASDPDSIHSATLAHAPVRTSAPARPNWAQYDEAFME